MKQLNIFILALVIVSCKKEVSNNASPGYLENVQTALKDSLSHADYASVDFSKAILSKISSEDLYLLRIPLKSKSILTDFVLLQTTAEGNLKIGKVIHLEGSDQAFSAGVIHSFYGNITISSLNRKTQLNSAIVNGYILALHPPVNLRVSTIQPSVIELPEVIVYSIYYNNSLSLSEMVWLQGLFYDWDLGGSVDSYYYSSVNGDGGGDYGDGYAGGGDVGGGYQDNGSTGDDNLATDPLVEVEKEYIYNLSNIDINKIFKCFDNVPSAGARYLIKLCSDVPSNNNPDASANFSAASGGHSFLTITKTSGSTSVTQSFGFYPASMPSWINPFEPVSSALKDNGAQEINASIQMSITESQFNIVKQNAIGWSTKSYELGDYNCSDYAVDIFNSIRANPLRIPGYQIILPGSTNPYVPGSQVTVTINKSPQMLFWKLKDMENSNDPEASNIRVDLSHNYRAPISKGECN